MSHPISDAVYDFIRSYQKRHRIPPTFREIADGCHVGTTTVHYHLKRLQASRRIRYTKRRARSIILLDEVQDE